MNSVRGFSLETYRELAGVYFDRRHLRNNIITYVRGRGITRRARERERMKRGQSVSIVERRESGKRKWVNTEIAERIIVQQ